MNYKLKLKVVLNWRLPHQHHVDKVKVISGNVHVKAEDIYWTWETEADIEGETVKFWRWSLWWWWSQLAIEAELIYCVWATGPLEGRINAWQDVTFIFQAPVRAEQPPSPLDDDFGDVDDDDVDDVNDADDGDYRKQCQIISFIFQARAGEKQATGGQTPLRYQVCETGITRWNVNRNYDKKCEQMVICESWSDGRLSRAL